MGQKVNPIGFRLKVGKSPFDWQSAWFAKKGEYRQILLEDLKIRQFLEEYLRGAGLVETKIKRFANRMEITLVVARPGVVIGRGGKGLEELKKKLIERVTLPNPEKNLELQVEEYKTPDLSAKLVARRIAAQLEKRLPHRRVVNIAMERVMNAGAEGVKVILAGRIAGAEIARTEKFTRGKVPLSTLRAVVDYWEEPALTKSGYIGVKVYIYKGEVE